MSGGAKGAFGGAFGPSTLNIGGHKIPYGFVAAGVGVVGVFLAWRAHQGVSVGAAPAAAAAAPAGWVGGPDVYGNNQEAQLANLTQLISNLQTQIGHGAPGQTGGSTAGNNAQVEPARPPTPDAGGPWIVTKPVDIPIPFPWTPTPRGGPISPPTPVGPRGAPPSPSAIQPKTGFAITFQGI